MSIGYRSALLRPPEAMRHAEVTRCLQRRSVFTLYLVCVAWAWRVEGVRVDSDMLHEETVDDILHLRASSQRKTSHRGKHKPFVIGISGASRSGKGELSGALVEKFAENGTHISQDDYFDKKLAKTHKDKFEWSGSIRHDNMLRDVAQAIQDQKYPIIVIEGFRAFHDKHLVELMDLVVWIEVSKATIFQRRHDTKPLSQNSAIEAAKFDKHLWARHLGYMKEVFGSHGPLHSCCESVLSGKAQYPLIGTAGRASVIVVDGEEPTATVMRNVLTSFRNVKDARINQKAAAQSPRSSTRNKLTRPRPPRISRPPPRSSRRLQRL